MTYTGETVTIIHESPGGQDAYGDPIEPTPTETSVTDVKVAPRSSDEPDERGNEGVIVGWTLYAPVGTTAEHDDKVRVRGEVCEIEGEIGVWPTKGVVINCKRA
jgi:hypothetical protein